MLGRPGLRCGIPYRLAPRMTIAYRPMAPDDRQFVLSGWSSSYRCSKYAGLISNRNWARVMHEEIGLILDDPGVRTIVACEPGELDHEGREFLYGFITARERYVFYVYVKKPYRYDPKDPRRRFRIGRGLFGAAGIDPGEPFVYATSTTIGDKILATCTCGLHRRDHIIESDCPRFTPKFPGEMNPGPAREAA